ncbi:MAG TPA: hypothetical protein VF209_01900, partial [Patescibacteria group bacterium]
ATQSAARSWSSQDFIILTGQLSHKPDQQEIFKKYFTNSLTIPLIHLDSSQHFFNQKSYFILFNHQAGASITDSNRLYWYNRLLELEKLDTIQNVIMVFPGDSHTTQFVKDRLLPRMYVLTDKHFYLFVTQAEERNQILQSDQNVTITPITQHEAGQKYLEIEIEGNQVRITPEF